MDIREKLKIAPDNPGVYLMKNSLGKIIYVGKASSLKSRISSYFQGGDMQPRTRWLVQEIADFEFIITDSPVEALILEANLIKKYHPYFNVQMRDDKRYPYLAVTLTEKYPRMKIVRRPEKKGDKYFGPYANARAIRGTMRLLKRIFKVRTCSYNINKPLSRPCLEYHINECDAPCIQAMSDEEYNERVKQVIEFMEGRTAGLIEGLRRKMETLAEALEFEKCAKIRNQINDIYRVTERQKVVTEPGIDEDYFAVVTEDRIACAVVFNVRDGKLIEENHFFLDIPGDAEIPFVIASFLKEYYQEGSSIPKNIYLQDTPEDEELIEEWLTALAEKRIHLRNPKRGKKLDVLKMALLNAKIRMKSAPREKAQEDVLLELKEELNLSSVPYIIEGYDVSNISGKDAACSLVLFEKGAPSKKGYRRFKIRTKDEPDDYSMLKEALGRRLSHIGETENEKWKKKPDLMLIDGGKGHLGVAVEALREAGIEGIELVSIAKKEEELFRPGINKPIRLETGARALKLLQRVRDEAHRFALSYHKKLRQKKISFSILDNIPGVGKARKKALIQHFKGIEKLKNASPREIAEVQGISPALAERITLFLR